MAVDGTNKQRALTLAFGGGKGAIGKSALTAHVAMAAARSGKHTLLIDLDTDSPNLHQMVGVGQPARTVQQLLEGRLVDPNNVVTKTRVENLGLVAGTWLLNGAPEYAHEKLPRALDELEAEVLVIDCGSSTQPHVINTFVDADVRFAVAHHQPSILEGTFGFIEAALSAALGAWAQGPAEEAELAKLTASLQEVPLKTAVERLAGRYRHLALAAAQCIETFTVHVLGNQLEGSNQGNIIHAFGRMLSDVLAIPAPVLGAVPWSKHLRTCTENGRPIYLEAPGSVEVRIFEQIATHSLKTDLRAARSGRPRHTHSRSQNPAGATTTAAALPGQLTQYLRKHERIPCDWTVTVRNASGQSAPGTLSDISFGGAGFHCDLPLTAGETVVLQFDKPASRPELQAVVRFARHGKAGIEYADEAAEKQAKKLVALAKGENARREALAS